MKKDIENLADIKLLVNAFYDHVKDDELLAPIFKSKITLGWQPHLEIMYRFWNAALFNVREYTGNPFMKHQSLPLHQDHFERWIALFYETIDNLFEGPVVDDAKSKAMTMAHAFYRRAKIEKELARLPNINKRDD